MSNGSVFLIDASRLFREGLRRIFSGSSFATIHESCSVQDALPFIEALQPSLVLVNFPDTGEALSEGIGQIRAVAPLTTRIVVLTETIRFDWLAEALSAGVDGYLLKNMSADALDQSLRLVLLGEKVFPTDLARLLTSDWMMGGTTRRKRVMSTASPIAKCRSSAICSTAPKINRSVVTFRSPRARSKPTSRPS
jgi:two-component system nitrate/nitrite response regulator NarL